MTTFLLIPGAGGQAAYFSRLVPELERRGHAAVAVDLPSGDDAAGLAAYADVAVAAVDPQVPVTVVAQSMGGLTAPLICARRPVELLVLLNAMVPAPGETGGEWWSTTGQDDAQRAHRASLDLPDDADGDDVVYFHDLDPELAATLREEPVEQSGRPFEEPWPLAAWPDVPTRVLAGRDDRLFPLEFQRRIARERLGLDVDEIPGGHLVALSRPAELAARLAAYARDLPAPLSAR
ncbi:alpha/beta fold hydrolase [Blastococcus sp. TF02A-30]|uniref:alpha/beta fold hydrolase n=1 Tax=Blastococcus sp. TF02A-30 TaxID=2250580 RepID=UPI000DEA1B40|nr:alpha/beta fold hydrolase [Blastococcus sp. TF02A-30]RBY91027.1 alpha/beta hydrolase [Blastococcus sp. TF02A-30]